MASAVLVSRNEPSWGEAKVYMRKYPNAVPKNDAPLKANPHHKPNNQNNAAHPSTNLHVKDTPSLVLSTDNGLSKRKPISLKEAHQASRVGRVTFDLGAYTRRELKDLKIRLLSELEEVRILKTRIDNTNFDTRPICPKSRPPLPVQVAHPTDPQQPNRSRTPKGKKRGRGSKRANPFSNSGQNPKRVATDRSAENVVSGMMRRCRQILGKLMKYKHGWVFNAPVDVVGLGLHDYSQIIQTPMDLGTVKSKMDKNLYKSPVEFASDVRLTFNNALKYNPKGHDVNSMAETLLAKFEVMFYPVFRKFEENSQNVSLEMAKAPKKKPPKARVKEMSMEEKKTLGRSLVELPQEKMVALLDIVKTKNGGLAQVGDEIVLDIEVLDSDTLWELDRFVSSYKKTLNRIQKKHQVILDTVKIEKGSGIVEEEEEEVGEEDVDIGEEIPVENYPPVEIEKDVTAGGDGDDSPTGSSSSSSGSDTSSSSGSDSESSSDNDDEGCVKSKDAFET